MGRKRKSTVKPPSKDVKPPPVGLTKTQDKFIKAMCEKPMVIVTGPAGTGKTFLSACYAGWFYKKGLVKKIVLSRPNIPTGKSLGAFPGTLEEKMEPWVIPFIAALEEYLGKGDVENLLRQNKIEVVPFEVIRGRTFEDSFVILDEAQNCSVAEIKAFVTRHGENSTSVINGDTTQSDVKAAINGLEFVKKLALKDKELKKEIAVIDFTIEDIVRSDLCKHWIVAFEKGL